MMATIRACCELSGYSNSSHTFRWRSLVGKGFSSSLIKPSSSLKYMKKNVYSNITSFLLKYNQIKMGLIIPISYMQCIHHVPCSNSKERENNHMCTSNIEKLRMGNKINFFHYFFLINEIICSVNFIKLHKSCIVTVVCCHNKPFMLF